MNLRATFLASTLLAASTINSWAQVSTAQMGITRSPLPEVLQVLDNTNTWVPIGNVSPTSHMFQSLSPGVPVSPRFWGAIGNGTVDDSTAVTQACTQAGALNLPLILDALFYVPSGVTCPNTVKISGALVSGGMGGGAGSYTPCTAGLTVNTSPNTTALTLQGSNNRVENVCFQMGSAWGAATGGAAISVGSGVNGGTASVIQNNQINYPFIGVDVSGTGSVQAAGITVGGNFIWKPSNGGGGVRAGFTGKTNDLTVRDNRIVCYDGAPNLGGSTAFGVQVLNSGGFHLTGDNDIYLCQYGTEIYPGLYGTANQSVYAMIDGVMGDTSTTNDLYVNTGNSTAQILALDIINGWASNATGLSGSSAVAAGPNVLVKNDGGGKVGTLKFTGGTYHASGLTPQPIVMDFQAGSDIVINGASICSPTGAPSTTGIRFGVNVGWYTLSGSHVGAGASTFICSGGLGTAIEIDNPTSGRGNITGNGLLATTMFNYVPNKENLIIENNTGLASGSCPTITNIPQITVAPGYPCAYINGAGTITDIINSNYGTRKFDLIFENGATLSTTGTAGTTFCTNSTYPNQTMASIRFNAFNNCWEHIP